MSVVEARPRVTIKEAAEEFLSHKRIAVTGVSRDPATHGSNAIYRRLRDRGYEVFAVNPNAKEVEGDRAYPTIGAIPGGVEAVVIATSPDHAGEGMRECVDLGIHDVWMHRAFGDGSVSDGATAFGREHGVTVIDGGCPLMFAPASDPGHRFFKVIASLTGKMPKKV